MSAGRPANRLVAIVALLAWFTVGAIGLLALSQAFDVTATTLVAVVQSLTPYALLLLVPIIAVALARRHLMLATVATAVGVGIAVLAVPVVAPNPQAEAAADAVGLRVASANLWYRNTEIATVARQLVALDADVLVFSEYTPEHRAALEASPLAGAYPIRSEVDGRETLRVSVWSRVPVRDQRRLDTFNSSVQLTVSGPDGDVDLVAVHMPTPVADIQRWQQDLETTADAAQSATNPVLVIGDLNAAYWHPDFRRLLDGGLVDAHIANGRGMSTSWPTGRVVPPFVRLDHALTGNGLVSTDVVDFDVTGSDHRGLMVTVAPSD